MSEQQLEQWAAELTGDQMVAAGRFFWRGAHDQQRLGVVASSVGEGATNEYLDHASGAQGEGDLTGGPAGFLVVAVSEANAYVLETGEPSPTTASDFRVVATFNRDHLAVKLHRRIGWRLLDLEDTASGQRLELETGTSTHDAHTKDVVHALSD